jgi:hypothetical protein
MAHGRGRPRTPALPGRIYGLGIHVTGELKALLENAADASGRSQGQEAALRIEASFDRERRLGGSRAVALLEALGAAAVAAYGDGWVDDDKAYDEVTRDRDGLWAEHLVRWRPVVTDAPRVARPDLPVDQASDLPPPGPPQRDQELLQRLLQLLEEVAGMLGRMAEPPNDDKTAAEAPTDHPL